MSAELQRGYDEVARLGTALGTAWSCWNNLLAYLSSHADIGGLSAVAIDEDVRSVRRQLISLIDADPPQAPLAALYFGLYDAIDKNGHEVAGFHVAGIRDYDPKNAETLCHPSWQPKGRYLKSASLDELKRAVLAALGEARGVVGFDSGDYVEFSD